jgi:SAM-dependent methyltransferase
MGRVDFDDYSDRYDELMKEQLGFFEKEEGYFAEYKIETVKRVIEEEPSVILEYGCGIGRNLRFLREKFPHAYLAGCDVSQNSIMRAKKENPDAELFLIGKDSIERRYDLILVANVLHHIASDQRESTLAFLAKLLTENGSLFFFEHNPLNPITRRIVRSCPFDSDAVLVWPGELRRLLHSFHFDIRHYGYCLFFPGVLKKLRELERCLKWLPLGGQYYINAYK